ncbi:hypothetical protein [Microbacterium enclense]|uniref:Uncharacterized protein n=1 Tax=Microbacterium enclense TaxID=993073 RepID=A0A1G6GMK0_9MICO|nr:hypothetical protein [Microbacterium enclense]KSU56346.1 hypothetical protein AS029_00885 [Microbacterium enclense]SDB82945.1 hypothetical protein SAMN05216418_0414 [Microbacterium enclense]
MAVNYSVITVTASSVWTVKGVVDGISGDVATAAGVDEPMGVAGSVGATTLVQPTRFAATVTVVINAGNVRLVPCGLIRSR